jgi:hypothetical protein
VKREEIFDVLEPPPYGWTRLEARLSERRGARWPLALPAVALAATASLLIAVVLAWPRTQAVDLSVEISRSSAAASFGLGEDTRTLAVRTGAAEALPSSDPNVVLYRVAMVETADSAE